MCDNLGIDNTEIMKELVSKYTGYKLNELEFYKNEENKNIFNDIYKQLNNCPVCMLSFIRRTKLYELNSFFDYKKESLETLNDIVNNQCHNG